MLEIPVYLGKDLVQFNWKYIHKSSGSNIWSYFIKFL